MKEPCEIIRDLLPLYHDGVCSAQSTQAVEAHLSECPDCTGALEAIRAEVQVTPPATAEDQKVSDAMRVLVHRWKRSWIMVSVTCVVAAVVLTLIGHRAYNALCLEDTVPIPASQVEVAYMYRNPEDQLWFRLRIKDGKAPWAAKWGTTAIHENKEGGYDEYWVTYRPSVVLGRKANALTSEISFGRLEGGKDEDVPRDVSRYYYGTPEEHILLWEPGMEVPVLTDEEARELFPDVFPDTMKKRE